MANGGNQDEEKGGLPRDLTKKILTLGLGAYFLTEDTVRRYVKDAKIPRDIGKTITQNASKGKDELYGFIARELSGFLKQMDIQEEIDRFVGSHKIRINAEIEFLPSDEKKRRAKQDDADESEEGQPIDADEEPARESNVEWNVSFKAGESDAGPVEPDGA